MREMLTKPYYGLKGWQWIAVIGMAGFVYFRMRSGGSSASTDTSGTGDTSGNAATDAGAQGFTQGYAQGYDTGNSQGQIAPTPNPPAGSKNCRNMTDPSGKTHLVCGPGAFQNLGRPGQTPVWRWVEGATHTVFAVGKKGNLFLHRPPAVQAHKPTGSRPPIGKKPVKQQPHAA